MNHKKLLSQVLFLAFLLFCLDGCFLFPDSSTKETLPPATQTGANTFGCYVNGKLWLPKGYNGTSNLIMSYDPTFNGGSLNLSAYRTESNDKQDILIGADSLSTVGIFNFNSKGSPLALYFDTKTSCSYNDPQDYLRGTLQITRLDLNSNVVSGTFEFVVAKSSCDTIKVTQGRFDMKL